ncbi:DUF2807 domain-containing protein [Myxococcota bacterium]|nr:DUF2807 domain-containing protein [Myxococcota bacterium]
MRITLFFLFSFWFLCLHLGCAIFVDGNGKISEQTLPIDNFQTLHLDYTFQVNAQPNAAYRVVVRADENIWPFLDIKKTNDQTLFLGRKSTIFSNTVKGSLEATVAMSSFSSAKVTNASRLTLGAFAYTETLTLDIIGASECSATSLSANSAQINVSGGSRLSLGGNIATLKIEASGGSTLDLSGLTAQIAEITLSGKSQINHLQFANNGRLRVRLSGASTLRYTGSPEIEILENSGGSQIIQQ